MSTGSELYDVDDDGAVRLQGMRCTSCGHVAFPYQTCGCERCGASGADLQKFALAARGVLTSHAVVHLHPAGGITPPFVIGEIRLDDGPSLRLTMVEAAAEVLVSGTPVHGVLHALRADDGSVSTELRFAAVVADRQAVSA